MKQQKLFCETCSEILNRLMRMTDGERKTTDLKLDKECPNCGVNAPVYDNENDDAVPPRYHERYYESPPVK